MNQANYYYLFITSLCIICLDKKVLAAEHSNTINAYLENLNGNILKEINEINKAKDSNDDILIKSYTFPQKKNFSNVQFYTLFDKNFIILNNEIYHISINTSSLNMNFYGNLPISNYLYLKVYQYDQLGFIAFSMKNEILFYRFEANETIPKIIHSISSFNNSDSIFFTNSGNLYFLTINCKCFESYITIYKWLGTYFDQITEVLTVGVVENIKSFSFKNAEILIVLKELSARMKVSSTNIYQFEKDNLKEIQRLIDTDDANNNNPLGVNIYFQHGTPYMLIYQNLNHHSLYKWNGYEMVLIHQLINLQYLQGHNNKSIVVYSHNIPFILQFNRNDVLIVKPHNNNLKLYQTKSYTQNLTTILEINKIENEKGNITFIAGLNQDNMLNIHWMSLEAHSEIDTEHNETTLQSCLNNLETTVYDRRKKLNQKNNLFSGKIQFTEKATTIIPIIKLKRSLISTSNNNNSEEHNNKQDKLIEIRERINQINDRIIKIKQPENFTNQFVFNGKVLIKGNLTTRTVTGKNIKFNRINGKNFTPNFWMNYDKEQNITGLVHINNLKTKNFILNKKNNCSSSFDDILKYSNNNQTITGKVKIKNLVVSKIYANQINNISLENISTLINDNSNNKTGNPKCHSSEIKEINGDIFGSTKKSNKFSSNVTIDELEVQTINNVSWTELQKVVFKIGEDLIINGNLIIPEFETINLTTKTINGINTDYLMTKTTDQIINSSIQFRNIESDNGKYEFVNKINISKAVELDKNATIISKVVLEDLEVLQDLIQKTKNQSDNDDSMFITNSSNFLQTYLGKIIINGDLYVNDFFPHPNLTLTINNKKYTMKELNEYWTKDTDQSINTHFQALNGISVTELKTKTLNEIPVENFSINNENSILKGPLFFENLTVLGNITIENPNNESLMVLNKLLHKSVVNNGTKYIIKGKKVFHNSLTTKELNISSNNVKIGQKLKNIETIRVKGNLLLANNISTEIINNINIKNRIDKMLFLNESRNLTELSIANLKVDKLYVKSINSYNIEEYLIALDEILKTKKIARVNIKGNITVENIDKLQTINNQNFQDLIEMSLNENTSTTVLRKNVRFTGKVAIKNFEADFINDVDYPDLTRRLLYKRSNLPITGKYIFSNLKTDKLNVTNINNINMENLIDISRKDTQKLTVKNGITLKNVNLKKSINAEEILPCNIGEAINKILSPRSQEWALIEIIGNTTYLDEKCDLLQIFKHSVKKHENNLITAPVTVKGNLKANTAKVKSTINNISLAELLNDLIYKDFEEEQIITGRKVFRNEIEADSVQVSDNIDSISIDDINISEFFENMIKKDSNLTIITGTKTFKTLQTNKIHTQNIGGIIPESLVTFTKLKDQLITNITFVNLNVTNELNVSFVNEHSVDYILKHRLLLNNTEKQIAEGIYYFTKLKINENLITPSINHIPLENITSAFKSRKGIIQDLTVFGGNNTNNLITNNDYMIETCSSLLNTQELTVQNPIQFEGDISIKKIGNFTIREIETLLDTKFDENHLIQLNHIIETSIKDTKSLMQNLPNELMYIENLGDFKIHISNAVDAKAIYIKDSVMINIISKESHKICNLPKNCDCLRQHSIEINPKLSVSYILNNNNRGKIFSYDDGSMTIHLISNSVSTSSYCRSINHHHEQDDENATLFWSISSEEGNNNNKTGTNHVINTILNGYISAAEFFTFNGRTYLVVARYYDSFLDSYDLDCTVIEFSEDKKNAKTIQIIPTHAAGTLYVSYTHQGVILVIGNLGMNPYTEIYRFNAETKQFKILTSFPIGCTKVAAVVRGTESILVLANENAPLHILKYYHKHEINHEIANYYRYQTINLNENILGLTVFYIGDFGISDAYLCIVSDGNYRIYSYKYLDGWQIEAQKRIPGLQNFLPFELDGFQYFFAPTTEKSYILKLIKFGPP